MKQKFRELAVRFVVFMREPFGVSTVEYALVVLGIIGIAGAGMFILGDGFEEVFTLLSGRMTAAIT